MKSIEVVVLLQSSLFLFIILSNIQKIVANGKYFLEKINLLQTIYNGLNQYLFQKILPSIGWIKVKLL